MTRLTRGVRRASAAKIVLARSERRLSAATSCTMRMPRVLRAPPSVPTLPRRAVYGGPSPDPAVAASRRAPSAAHGLHPRRSSFFSTLLMILAPKISRLMAASPFRAGTNRPNDQHRPGQVTHHPVGDAAQHPAIHTAPPVGTHGNQGLTALVS